MKPTFKTALAWEQAELLMQPVFIRVLDNLRKQLEDSSWQGSYEEVQVPYLGYQLVLTKGNHSILVDIWHLCFQVCFLDYPLATDDLGEKRDADYPVDIDLSLIDDTGEVDWQLLENKTQRLIVDLFAQLPRD